MCTCIWKGVQWNNEVPLLDIEDVDYYETSCDNAYQFLEGGLQENNFNYCPFCGEKIELSNSENNGNEINTK